MHLLSELSNEIDHIVLVDTNLFINFEHCEYSAIEFKSFKAMLKTNCKPFFTDLSFCELIVGCRNLSDYKYHCNNLNNMEFMLCGAYEPLCKFLSSFNYNLINNDEEFNDFKAKVIGLRNKALYPIFLRMLELYIKICIMNFHKSDREYWNHAFFIFNDIFYDECNNKEFNDLIFEHYEKFVDDKHESKKLIKDLFNELISKLLVYANPEKYIEEEIYVKLQEIISPKNFINLFKELNAFPNKSDKDWLIKGFIKSTRKLIDIKDESPIITDGICFIVSKIIFNGASFNAHDLIDLFNIYFSTSGDVNFHYFTNDCKKWGEFVRIENSLRPNIKISLNG